MFTGVLITMESLYKVTIGSSHSAPIISTRQMQTGPYSTTYHKQKYKSKNPCPPGSPQPRRGEVRGLSVITLSNEEVEVKGTLP